MFFPPDGRTSSKVALLLLRPRQLDLVKAAANGAALSFEILAQNIETTIERLSIGTMHLAKGLEFRAVAVTACADEVIPIQNELRLLPPRPTWRTFTTPSATCFTASAPAPAIIYS